MNTPADFARFTRKSNIAIAAIIAVVAVLAFLTPPHTAKHVGSVRHLCSSHTAAKSAPPCIPDYGTSTVPQ